MALPMYRYLCGLEISAVEVTLEDVPNLEVKPFLNRYIPYCLAVMPARCYAPPPIFGRNYCIGLFYLHYMPPPGGARAGLLYCNSCTCTRVASVEELYSCMKRVENSLRTGLGLFH